MSVISHFFIHFPIIFEKNSPSDPPAPTRGSSSVFISTPRTSPTTFSKSSSTFSPINSPASSAKRWVPSLQFPSLLVAATVVVVGALVVVLVVVVVGAEVVEVVEVEVVEVVEVVAGVTVVVVA